MPAWVSTGMGSTRGSATGLLGSFSLCPRGKSESAPEYMIKDSDEKSADIVAYDTETSHYTTVTDWD